MLNQHPVPVMTPWAEPQFEYARKGILSLQKSPTTGEVWYLPSVTSPVALMEEPIYIEASGRGTLWSWVRMHQPYMKAFVDEIPYLVAAVKLEEGPILMSTVVDIDPADLEFDMPLQVEFVGYGEQELPMPVFRVVR